MSMVFETSIPVYEVKRQHGLPLAGRVRALQGWLDENCPERWRWSEPTSRSPIARARVHIDDDADTVLFHLRWASSGPDGL
jgi:hypothetical protein